MSLQKLINEIKKNNELETLVSRILKPITEDMNINLQKIKDDTLHFYENEYQLTNIKKKYNTTTEKQAKEIKKNLLKEFGEDKFKLGVSLFHEDIKKLVEKDMKKRAVKLISQIEKALKGDKVIDIKARPNERGFLDAIINLDSDYVIDIYTILASGFVQKIHYRTLVKRKKI